MPGKIEALLRELKLELPARRVPAANHMPAKRLGNVLYITCDLNLRRDNQDENAPLLG